MDHYKFCVDERPFCLFEHELEKINEDYLESINPDYYHYIATQFEHTLSDKSSVKKLNNMQRFH